MRAAGLETPEGEGLRILGALVALSLALFAQVTNEGLPVGLLPQLATGLHHSRSAIGYLVSAYAAVVVIGAVPIAHATRHYPRRRLLLIALSTFVVGTALSAAAQSYDELLITRMATAVAHCVFAAVILAAGAALVPHERRGRALGIVLAGTTFPTILGVPTLTWLGQQTSWRVASLAVSGVGLISLCAIYVLLPSASASEEREAVAPHVNARKYAITLITVGLVAIGAFAVAIYVTVFLTELGGIPNSDVGPVLLTSGVAGALGIPVGSRFVTKHCRATIGLGILGLALTLFSLAAAARHGAADVALFCSLGFFISILSVGAQTRGLDVAPGNVNVASAGVSAMFNAGICGGAFLGGILLQGPGARSIAVVGGLLAVGSFAILLVEPWLVQSDRMAR